ncbi:MAG: ABC transporter ATP-binding protein [Magnetovibrio sp.]|nr:ABC transporter ATP-binding protein [Magnetovibrio sp.]
MKTNSQAAKTLLQISNLKTHLFLSRGVVKAVDGVTFDVREGETVGLVGESGSGKSMTGLSILRLLPNIGARVVDGSITIDGVNILDLSEKEMAGEWRGRRISMVSQDPLTSLNPLFTFGDQVGAPPRYHNLTSSRSELRAAVIDGLKRVSIPAVEDRFDAYPHQFSGGQRQRVVSAMALACSPRLMIADEPTSSLDVTIQVQMIDLYRRIQEGTGLGIILITHDLGTAASICKRIAVMYAGRIVEFGDVRTIFNNPRHPYTQALINSIPHLGQKKKRLYALPGQPPSFIDPPTGCRFAPRCTKKMTICETYPPDFISKTGHRTACWLEETKEQGNAA